MIGHPVLMTHASVPVDRRHAMGLSDRIVWLSCEVEGAADLVQALAHA